MKLQLRLFDCVSIKNHAYLQMDWFRIRSVLNGCVPHFCPFSCFVLKKIEIVHGNQIKSTVQLCATLIDK